MFVLLLVIASGAAHPPPKQDGELEVVESVNHYYSQPVRDVPVVFPAENPPELNYPVKTVQKFMDSDGNVQVVTSYSNRNDNPAPIYKSRPINQFNIPERTNIRVAPDGTTRQVTFEERSVPKKQQIQKTKTIRFPDDRGQYVENEEKTSYSDGNTRSFSTESAYSKPVNRGNVAPRKNIRHQSEDGVSFRRAKNPVNKDVSVASPSVSKPVRKVPVSGKFRSSKPADDDEDAAISGSKNEDHALEPAGSSYISDIEEAEVDDDSGYDDSVEEHHHVGYGGGDIGDHHGPHHHHHGIGHGHGHSHGHSFKKEGGQAYKHGEHYAKGDKGGKGHKSKETYAKGHKEEHGHEHKKGEKKEEVGEKKGHLDEHNEYHKGHAHHKGAKGKEKSSSKGHKKGKKTSGFRTVHHKDEYKKDEVFYDEEHDAGHEKVHGHEEGGHHETKGGEAKKGHLDSGYKDAVKGVEGAKKEGHSYENSKGHSGHAGHKAHEGHKEGFHKGEGHKAQEAHGSAHKGKGGWH